MGYHSLYPNPSPIWLIRQQYLYLNRRYRRRSNHHYHRLNRHCYRRRSNRRYRRSNRHRSHRFQSPDQIATYTCSVGS